MFLSYTLKGKMNCNAYNVDNPYDMH